MIQSKKKRAEIGAVFVEAAIILPLFFILLFASMQLIVISWRQLEVQFLVNDLVRTMALPSITGMTAAELTQDRIKMWGEVKGIVAGYKNSHGWGSSGGGGGGGDHNGGGGGGHVNSHGQGGGGDEEGEGEEGEGEEEGGGGGGVNSHGQGGGGDEEDGGGGGADPVKISYLNSAGERIYALTYLPGQIIILNTTYDMPLLFQNLISFPLPTIQLNATAVAVAEETISNE